MVHACMAMVLGSIITTQSTCRADHSAESIRMAGVPGNADYPGRAGARAQLYAAGYKAADFGKPIVTVAAPYLSVHMCNQKFRQLADAVSGACPDRRRPIHGRRRARAARPQGLCIVPARHQRRRHNGQQRHAVPALHGTMWVMAGRFSLVSRDLIADCIELMHDGYRADALVTLAGCVRASPAPCTITCDRTRPTRAC